jgi:uncharacterized protein YndB with AHSA1/START domain
MTDRTTHSDVDGTVMAAVETAPVEARLEERDGRWVLTMERALAADPARVWAMITDPERAARWSPCVPDRPLTSVGPATARENPSDEPMDAEVLEVDPPRLLVHRWDAHLLRWSITPDGDGSILRLEHAFDVRSEASEYGAGWHICLAVLTAQVSGHETGRVTGDRARDYGWPELNERYAGLLGL